MRPSYGNCITELVTEIPRSFSSAIQSDVAWRVVLRDLTEPAIWIAPPNSNSFSVSVVLPASGWEMMAKVRRRAASIEISDGRSDIAELYGAGQHGHSTGGATQACRTRPRSRWTRTPARPRVCRIRSVP